MSINNPDTNDHPLTVARAAELWGDHAPSYLGQWRSMSNDRRAHAVSLLRAGFNVGRQHERTNPEDDRPWEPLNGPVRVGDEVRQDLYGITRTAVVARVDENGNPWSVEGYIIGVLDDGTWHVRRAVQELPTTSETVIVANDGHEYIEATLGGVTCRTREAFLSAGGLWMGVWRSSSGQVLLAVSREFIVQDTWKVDDR